MKPNSNPIVHFEIHAKNMNVIQKFYTDVFGWSIKDMGPDMGNYRLVATGGNTGPGPAAVGINGGLTPREGALPTAGQVVNAFVNIVGVDDVAVSIDKVKKAGGAITADVVDVPNIGKLAYATDPEGNLFGMLQPAQEMQ